MDVKKTEKKRNSLQNKKSENYEHMTTTNQRMVLKHHSVIDKHKK
jgi:hypothetical protein